MHLPTPMFKSVRWDPMSQSSITCSQKNKTKQKTNKKQTNTSAHIKKSKKNPPSGTETKMFHYNDVTMSAVASQINSFMIVYSTVYSGADQNKHQSSASLAFVRGIHRWPMNSSYKRPATRKMVPFDDVIMPRETGQYPELWLKMISMAWPLCHQDISSYDSDDAG